MMKDEEMALPAASAPVVATTNAKAQDDDTATVSSADDKAIIKPIKVVEEESPSAKRTMRWIILAVLALVAMSTIGFVFLSCGSKKEEEVSSASVRSVDASSSTAVAQQQTAPDNGTSTTTEKTSWPELRGLTVDAATLLLEEENPDLDIVVADRSEAATLTRDFVPNRVILVTCSGSNIVAKTPVIG